MSSLLIFVLALFMLPERDNLSIGSVLALSWGKSSIAIAADSRTVNGKGEFVHDSECKVTIVQGRLILAIAGVSGNRSSSGHWNALDEGRALANSEFDIAMFAQRWAERISARIKSDIQSGDLSNYLARMESAGILTAIVIGTNRDGKVGPFAIQIKNLNWKARVPYPTLDITVGPIRQSTCTPVCGIGRLEIINEYKHGTDSRATKERRLWARWLGNSPPGGPDRIVRRAVELTISSNRYAQDVGGAIDLAEFNITRGTARWIQCKSNCFS